MDTIIAYLNIVELNLIVDDTVTIKMLGIGNVCVDKQHLRKEYGFLLMKIVEYYLRRNKINGLLLCKEHLIPFYDAVHWIKYEGKVFIRDKPFNGTTYTYNPFICKKLVLDKNF
jgi:hypothetical protein